ncbi:MAG: HAD-IB family hydrolase, partial [Microbacteriaceae bacterium]
MTPAGEHTPAIAFFDVDNTIVDGSTMFQLARTAWSEGFIGVVDVARFAWHQLTFRTVGETGAQMRTARGRGLKLIEGKPSEAIR